MESGEPTDCWRSGQSGGGRGQCAAARSQRNLASLAAGCDTCSGEQATLERSRKTPRVAVLHARRWRGQLRRGRTVTYGRPSSAQRGLREVLSSVAAAWLMQQTLILPGRADVIQRQAGIRAFYILCYLPYAMRFHAAVAIVKLQSGGLVLRPH